jgi:hypothetical protein
MHECNAHICSLSISCLKSWDVTFHFFLNYLYLVVLLNLKVSYAFMFCSLMKDKLKTICYVFPYDLNTRLTFIVSFLWSFVCVFFHVITWLLSCFYQDYVFHAHVLSSLIPVHNTYIYGQDCIGACHLKNYFFYFYLPTRGRAGVKLGDADTSQTYL